MRYAILCYEGLNPSPVATLNRAVALEKISGAKAAFDMIEPLAGELGNYFHFFGLREGCSCSLAGPTRRASLSTRRQRSPIRRRRLLIYDCISTGSGNAEGAEASLATAHLSRPILMSRIAASVPTQ